ncbi:penicillin-binding protein [Clostridium sp. YIM B02505]|uniref:Penicillin-binding protein n=1 Tax=Clostridium yunnanense TaxID=2800325 RepID=A0ABS1EPS5_9CLOT|nr:penicillin-binding transpeptidase domain-containing protein [Clostridium yunnanense]MBK1811352.1 penicillin-binding protein [Clostridium yunnanense]
MNNVKKKKKTVNRYTVVIVIMFIIFSAIVARLIYLQIFKYDDYTDRANTSSRRLVTEKAPRGKIYDSQGNLLATNKQVYTLTFTQTDDSSKSFYTTMKQVFKLLDENKDSQQDTLNLKINDKGEPYFDFNVSTDDSKRALEIRFKRDRGMNDDIKKKLFKGKQELTDDDESKIDEELVKISAKDTFYYMVKFYQMYDMLNPTAAEKKTYKNLSAQEITEMLLKKFSINDIRRYMLVKDAIKMQSFSGFKPVTIAANIKKDTASIFYQKLTGLPGVDVALEPMRYYPYGQYNLASSVIGYVASIDSSRKDRYEERGYDVSTDVIGKAGIESAFESVLKGNTGGTTIKVDSQGRKTEELFDLEPSPGEDVHLSIDKNIQYSAEKSLQERMEYVRTQVYDPQFPIARDFNTTRGAVVAIEAKTGRVLAMASNPGFDANIFSEPGKLTPELSKQFFNPDYEAYGKMIISKYNLNKTIDELFPKDANGNRQDKYDLYPKPFYNYATQGLIPPGSTFKPLTSLAALEEGVVNPKETLYGKKYFDTRPLILGSWAPADEHEYGIVDLKRALAVSCNFYYYEMGVRMYVKNGQNTQALDSIAKYAWQLGMGTDPKGNQKGSTGIEIGENFGQTYNYEYFKSQTLYYSRYELVDFLSKGAYGTGYNFVPLDIEAKDDDDDKLKETKQKIKDAVIDVLKNSTNSKISLDGFETKLSKLLSDLETNSKVFSDRIKEANNSGRKYSQKTVIIAMEQFIFDKNGAINTPAELVNASIGQGVNNFSLVQLASYISTIANGGTRYKTHLVDKITDNSGNVLKEYKPEVLGKIDIKPENLAAIKQGMQMVNNGTDEGTARIHFVGFPILTAGKTGTATYKDKEEEYGRSDYSVYVSFAPVDDPQIVVAVVMYDGYQGNMGAPVARAIYETYFRDQIKQQFPSYQPMFNYTLNPPLEDVKDDNLK